MIQTKFEELLAMAIDLYIEEENKRLEEEKKNAGNIEFSENHKRKMKELFDSLREQVENNNIL